MKTIPCDQCWGTGEIEVLADSSSVYNPNESPRYATITCDECGGYGDIEIPDEEEYSKRLTNDQFDRFMAICNDTERKPSARIMEAAKRLDEEEEDGYEMEK